MKGNLDPRFRQRQSSLKGIDSGMHKTLWMYSVSVRVSD